MFTFRPTQKLLKRMRAVPEPETPAATTTLGDWYANTLSRGSQRYIMVVAEKSLLPVIIPLREAKTAPVRLRAAVRESLTELGIPSDRIEQELAEMQEYKIAKTNSKVVLGVMNNLADSLDYYAYDWPIDELSKMLRETPFKPIGYDSPERYTRNLLG